MRLDTLHSLAAPDDLRSLFHLLNREEGQEEYDDAVRRVVDVLTELAKLPVEPGEVPGIHWSLRPGLPDVEQEEQAAVSHFRDVFGIPDTPEYGRLLKDVAALTGARGPQDRAWLYRALSDPAFTGPDGAAERAWTGRWLSPLHVILLMGGRTFDELRNMHFVDFLATIDGTAAARGGDVQHEIEVAPGGIAAMTRLEDWVAYNAGRRGNTGGNRSVEEYARLASRGVTLGAMADYVHRTGADSDLMHALYEYSADKGRSGVGDVRELAEKLHVDPASALNLLYVADMVGLHGEQRSLLRVLRGDLLAQAERGANLLGWNEQRFEHLLEQNGVDVLDLLMRGGPEAAYVTSLFTTLHTWGAGIEELPGLAAYVRQDPQASGLMPVSYDEATPEQRRALWEYAAEHRDDLRTVASAWRSGHWGWTGSGSAS